MSEISSADGAEDQRVHTNEEKENGGPSADKFINCLSEATKVQPTLNELADTMKKVLEVLQHSTFVSKSGKDDRSRFWELYGQVAEEHDSDFLERYFKDMDSILLFSGLFSTVSSSFIVAMESSLSPDPSNTTNALLTQLVQIGFGNFTAAGSTPADPASTWSPPASVVRIQMVAYASLSMSLLAAFAAVLGKQWLSYYKSKRYGRGSLEQRGQQRQLMFDGLATWYFNTVVQSFPVLLQISLLLFEIALAAHMWYERPSIAWVIIAIMVSGFLFYSLTAVACSITSYCPFQTPASTALQMLGIDKVLSPIFESSSRYFRQLKKSAYAVLQRGLGTLRPGWNQLSKPLRSAVCAASEFARRSLKSLSTALQKGLRYLASRSSTNAGDLESQQDPDALVKSTSDVETRSIKWLLEISTDPEIYIAAACFIPQVKWPLDLDVPDIPQHVSDIFTGCIGFDGQILPSLKERASACAMILSHLYYGRVLEAYPGHSNFFGRERQNGNVLSESVSFFIPDTGSIPALEPLLRVLPYHFVTGRVEEYVEKFAIAVISKLLSSPSSPSNQTIADCIFLACVMVGVQFDKKDIILTDKSAVLPQVTQSLLAQFQRVLCAWDGGDLDKDSTGITRRAWGLLDIICRMLELAQSHYNRSFNTMRNLDVCRKIYSRANSYKQNDPAALQNDLAALQNALHFTFTAAKVSRDPDYLWNQRYLNSETDDSHSPGEFDWLVDYFEGIYYDQEVGFDILLVLGSMKVRFSPAQQHRFIETLVACMGSNKPVHFRYAALRAAHTVREEIASINDMDAGLRDMVLTKLSPAILTTVCPRPGTTLADDPHYFFDFDRDLCYLELIYALAKDSNWHPHLLGDHHIDWCNSMIEEYRMHPPHAFYLAGILIQIAPEQSSVTSFDAMTEQQWWDIMWGAWYHAEFVIDDTHLLEFLSVLAEGMKRYIQIASEDSLRELVRYMDEILEALEERYSEQGEGVGVIDAVKELRTVASDKLVW